MKPPPYLKLLCLAALMVCSAFAQTKTVLKNVGANTLTESFIVPSGASITVAPGASIINQGTATGFDTSITVPWSSITSKPTTLAGFGITDGLTSATAASTYLTQASATSTYLTQSAAASTYLTSATASSTYLTLSAASSTYLTQAAAASTYLTSASASSTYLTSATAASTYLTLSAAASTYLTQAAAIAGYQPKDEDLTSIAALTTTTFGRSLLTQPSAIAARRAIQASIEVPAVPQVTAVSFGGLTSGDYIDIPYSATAVLRLWFNVDAGGGAPSAPGTGMLAEVPVSSSGPPNDWAYAVSVVGQTTSGTTGLTFFYDVGPGAVNVTQPVGVTAPFTGTASFTANITTPAAAAYDKLPALRMDDMVLSGQETAGFGVASFNGDTWVNATSLAWFLVSKDGSSLADLATRSASDLNSGTLAGARLPAPTTTVLGGVKRNTGTTGQYVSGIDSAGALLYGGPAPDVRVYTANSTWTNPSPSTPRRVFVRLVGGGGGGGSGRKGNAGTIRTGGGGGGGAAVIEFWALTTELGSTESVTVGAGGTGGASQATDATNGNPGLDGGNSIFAGTTAVGGSYGFGGTTTTGTAGALTANASVIGVDTASSAAGGAAGANGVAGAAAAAVLFHAPTGGGGGGGLDASNTNRAGGAGGNMGTAASTTLINGGTAGATGGGNGGDGLAGRGSGTGGGGGGTSSAGAGGNGGNGGGFGSGGGGGGAGTSAVGNSGKGGDGAPGYILVITY